MNSRSVFRKNSGKALLSAFLITALFTMFPFAASSGLLSTQVMRLHVLANSNSPKDQQMKLKVRDAVLKEAAKWYEGAASLEEANCAVCTHLQSIEKAAEDLLREEGVREEVSVCVGDRYFSTRSYENLRLPAGKYRTLEVRLGEGKGRNWWCIVFPALCLPGAGARQEEETVLSGIPQAQRKEFQSSGGYEVKFKLLEWYEAMKGFFDR